MTCSPWPLVTSVRVTKHHGQSDSWMKRLFVVTAPEVRIHDGGVKAWWQEQGAKASHPEPQVQNRESELEMALESSPS